MKKLMKKRLPLAILAIVLVTSMVLASTYAWFVSVNDFGVTSDEDVLTAKAKAAFFSLDIGEGGLINPSLSIEEFHPYWNIGADGGKPDFPGVGITLGAADFDRDPGKLWGDYAKDDLTDMPDIPQLENGAYIFYPGDALRIEFNVADSLAEDLIGVTYNRDVIVEIDASDLAQAFADAQSSVEDAIADLNAANTNDILNAMELASIMDDDQIESEFARIGDKFYARLTASGTEEFYDFTDELASINFKAEFGIIGLDIDQNHYMDIGPMELNLTAAVDDETVPMSIGITIVQATKQAVIDVFGNDVAEALGFVAVP